MNAITQPTHTAEFSIEEEATLVARLKAGDQAACAEFVTRFGPQMISVARRFMRCDDDCNDALQDAFISAFNTLARFRADSRLSTWLHRIIVNSCLMKLRKDSSRRETSIEEGLAAFDQRCQDARRPAAVNDPSMEVEINETRALILKAIDKLPNVERLVLLMRDIEEMDIAATATRLGMTRHNVKRRLRRARQALCTRLEPMMTGDGLLALAV